VPKKYSPVFFLLAVVIMMFFAMAGVSLARFRLEEAVVFLLVATLLSGAGFIARRRILRREGALPPLDRQE
jgi:hypothetical protein